MAIQNQAERHAFRRLLAERLSSTEREALLDAGAAMAPHEAIAEALQT